MTNEKKLLIDTLAPKREMPETKGVDKPELKDIAEVILDDAMAIIASEIRAMKDKVKKTKMTGSPALNTAEVTMLQKHVKSLVELKKEMREQTKEEDASGLSDEELIAQFQKSQERLEKRTREAGVKTIVRKANEN